MNSGTITYSVKDAIATIEFSHPKANSLPLSLLHSLRDAITHATADSSARVVLLRSSGDGAFCAGASFEEFSKLSDQVSATRFFAGFAEVLLAMRDCPKFIVARVHGKAVGGGVGLVAGADYAIGSNSVAFRLSEFELGFGPFTIGPAVARKIGTAAFSAMTIDTGWRDAAWAKFHGLLSAVTEAPELDTELKALLTRLAAASPEATAALKKLFWEGSEDWPRQLPIGAETSGRLMLAEKARKNT